MPAEATARLSQRRVPELDGVRGLAILLVLAYHFALAARPPAPLSTVLSLGWSGVDLFFVLSGLLITGILLDTRDSREYFKSFYARRALRIFPLYYVYIAAFFFLALPLARARGVVVPEGPSQFWYWTYLSNWRSALGPDWAWLSHLWSLAIEEQFYLLWPPIVLLLGPRRLKWLCAALIAAALASRIFWHDHNYGREFLYRLTPFRLEPIAWGALLAVFARDPGSARRRLGWAWIAALVLFTLLALWTGSVQNTTPAIATLGFSLVAVVYASLVEAASVHAGGPGFLQRTFRSPILTSCGKYSYAMYVLHFPMVGYWNSFFGPRAAGALSWFLWLPAFLAGAAATYTLAWLSWHLLEKRFLALKDRFAIASSPAPAARQS